MRGWVGCTILAAIVTTGGCRVCESGDDCAYPAYGGSWQRTNRNHGRVGSIFAPAGAKVPGAAIPGEPINRPIGNGTSDKPSEDDADDSRSLLDDLEDDAPKLEPLDAVEEVEPIDQT
ncbi:MAG: hypothetical protein R3C05_04425 [Pirellulaceae bacterium]